MQITVEYSAQVKRAAGVPRETFELPEHANLETLVAEIGKRHGPELSNLLLAGDGKLHPSILVFVGERQIRGEDDHALDDGASVSFLSPISGG